MKKLRGLDQKDWIKAERVELKDEDRWSHKECCHNYLNEEEYPDKDIRTLMERSLDLYVNSFLEMDALDVKLKVAKELVSAVKRLKKMSVHYAIAKETADLARWIVKE